MVAGLAALFLFSAAAQPTPSIGEAASPPVIEGSAPDVAVDTLQLEIDGLRERRPSLVPPLIVLGAGFVALGLGIAIVAVPHCEGDVCGPNQIGLSLALVGIPTFMVGMIWLVVDAVIVGNLNSQIGRLEAQQASRKDAAGRSHGPTLAPWARGGAGGLALSLPLP
jgi:hypothetical protein